MPSYEDDAKEKSDQIIYEATDNEDLDEKTKEEVIYQKIGLALGVTFGLLVFAGVWVWCVIEKGFLVGGAIGWLVAMTPAFIIGTLVRYFWRVLLVGGVLLVLWYYS